MIYLRSPYFVSVTDTNLTSADINIRIYTGTADTSMGGAQYSLSSESTDNSNVYFDISELCRDYIESSFTGLYQSDIVYINYQVTKYISSVAQTPESVVTLEGADGYLYFEDQYAYTIAPFILQSNSIIYRYADAPFNIPVKNDLVSNVTFYSKGKEMLRLSPTVTNNTNEIYHAIYPISYRGFKYRMDQASAEYDDGALDSVLSLAKGYRLHDCDTVVVSPSSGGAATFINVVTIDERKYEPVKVTFVNKFGALQDMWFFKAKRQTSSISSDTYKRNIVSAGAYSVNKHVRLPINKNSIESLELNSGLYDEQYNEVFRQLLLSENVWVTVGEDVIPVIVSTSSFTYNTSVNDKKVEFQLRVEYAFDKLNNTR